MTHLRGSVIMTLQSEHAAGGLQMVQPFEGVTMPASVAVQHLLSCATCKF